MSVLDDWRVKEALEKYVAACGGDPKAATPAVVLAERALEEEIGRKIGRAGSPWQRTLRGVE